MRARVFLLAGALLFPLPGGQSARRITGVEPGGEETRSAAHDYYRQGRVEWNQRTEQALLEAERLFRMAIKVDAQFAPAYAGLADVYNMLGDYRFLPPREAYARAQEAARQALALDPGLAEAHTSLGWSQCIFDWKPDIARHTFERALALAPDSAIAHHFYAFCLGSLGLTDEAESLILRACSLDPQSLIIATDLAVIRMFQQRYEEAIAQLEEIVRSNPDFITAVFALGMSYEATGRLDEALRELKRAVALSQESSLTLALLGHAYASAGDVERARVILTELLKRAETRYVSSLDIAVLYGALGEHEAAWSWLENAFEERAPWMLQLAADPRFATLRSHPGIEDLIERHGLPHGLLR